jgi:hypothetical protein
VLRPAAVRHRLAPGSGCASAKGSWPEEWIDAAERRPFDEVVELR